MKINKPKPVSWAKTHREALVGLSTQLDVDIVLAASKMQPSAIERLLLNPPHLETPYDGVNRAVSAIDHTAIPLVLTLGDEGIKHTIHEFGIEDKITLLEAMERSLK